LCQPGAGQLRRCRRDPLAAGPQPPGIAAAAPASAGPALPRQPAEPPGLGAGGPGPGFRGGTGHAGTDHPGRTAGARRFARHAGALGRPAHRCAAAVAGPLCRAGPTRPGLLHQLEPRPGRSARPRGRPGAGRLAGRRRPRPGPGIRLGRLG
ncbi:hypothetical protein KXX11_004311, partial [Aspergillus fumigatus]